MAVPKLRFKADDGSDYPEWNDFTKLEDISAFITKGATPTTYGFDWQPNGVYFFRNDCIKNNVFVYGDYSFITEEANKFLQRSEVTGGDIVIAITGDIGKVGLIPSEVKKANINQHLARVRIVKDAFPYFVYMYLCSDKVQRTYKKIKTGLSMPQLSLAQIRDTNIPRVSLPEQQKIAEFLSTIDTVIAKQKETVSAWEERKKGVMQKLFSQEVRFKADDGSEFPEWEEDIGCNRINIINGKPFDSKKFTTVDNGNPIIRIRDLDECTITLYSTEKYEEKYKVKKGSILIGMDGDFSVVKWNNVDVGLNQRIMHVIGKNDYIDDFMYYQLMPLIHEINVRTPFSTVKHLSSNTVLNMKLLIPCLEEQQKIADCLSSLDEVIEKQKAILAAWEELKKGLLQQMFI